jgi:uncharacterized protein (DUF1501 family)
MSHSTRSDRREFLRKLSTTFAAGSAAALLPQLALMPKAAAASTANGKANAPDGAGYKALVCIYLNGANDSFNWLIPRDSELSGSHYDRYKTARGGVYSGANTAGLAHAFSDILPINPSNVATAFGLHPACGDFTAGAQAHSGLQTLFSAGKAAFVCNAGTLIAPINKTQYNGGAPKPAQLFSHNDQAAQWQIGMSKTDPVSRFGWGGRVAKAVAPLPLSNGLSQAISAAGSTRFLLGDQLTPYQIATNGVNLIDNYTASATSNFQAQRRALLNDLLDDSYSQPFAKEYATLMRRSLSVGEDLSARLGATTGAVSTVFPTGNSLADQLKIVARMIKISKSELSAQRQVFFVNFGSFDLHDGMFIAGQPVATAGHGALLTALNQAVGAFWTAMNEIGAQDQVTSFTMSDFARTLTGNGNGSDHAWGGNMMVLGGAVAGNKLYGNYPRLIVNNDDNLGSDWSFSRGQYIPTTAVDQIAATLAKWMGVTDTNAMNAIFPNLDTFGTRDLGFMA